MLFMFFAMINMYMHMCILTGELWDFIKKIIIKSLAVMKDDGSYLNHVCIENFYIYIQITVFQFQESINFY